MVGGNHNVTIEIQLGAAYENKTYAGVNSKSAWISWTKVVPRKSVLGWRFFLFEGGNNYEFIRRIRMERFD